MREVPIHHIQHNNDNHLEVHEPAVSIHLYRHTNDHHAVLECKNAVSQSALRGAATWLSHTQVLPLTHPVYMCFSIRSHAGALFVDA